jgi:uncharacterized membrane protein
MSTETQNNEQQVSGQNPASDSQQPSVSVYNMTDREKWLAFISYIWLLFILSALLAENSPYIKFHVNQSLWVFILFQVSGYIIAMIPFVNCVILPVLMIASLVYMVLGLINAWQGKMEPLPFFDRLPVLYQ